jgi:hypothetical protein
MMNYGFSTPLSPSSFETKSDMEQLKYIKLGTEIGAGYRFHQNVHGCDLSLNYTSLFGETWTGGKALYLFYPFSSSGNHFYVGAGAGVVYGTLDLEKSMPAFLSGGRGHVSIHKNKTYPTFETAIGYEFLADRKVKLFTQFDLTVPFDSEPLPLFIKGPGEGWKPSITLGIGF